MDIVRSLGGSQPLRSKDWELIQNVEKSLLSAILNGLLPAKTGFIVSGLAVTLVDDVYNITEGYYFDGEEIIFVPESQVHNDGDGMLIFTLESTTTEQREFKDTTLHDVWELRRGVITYGSVVPQGSLVFDDIPMITKLADSILSNLQTNLTSVCSLIYLTGFTHQTALATAWLSKNVLGFYQILAAFNATVEDGHIFTIPSGHRPTGDLTATFDNGSQTPGVLKIRKDGKVVVMGASLGGMNYISFQYFKTFFDPVLGTLPLPGEGLGG